MSLPKIFRIVGKDRVLRKSAIIVFGFFMIEWRK